jgi:hypothetical protein
MNRSVKKLVADVAAKCLENGFSLKLIAKKSIDSGGIECSGYFDETDLIVATKKKDWVDVLAHESCHLDQYIEGHKSWGDGESGIISVDEWLLNKKRSNRNIEKSIKSIILLELDCEKKTVKKMLKYKIALNKDLYIQKANAYLFSYWATFRDRKWFKFPYDNPKIYKKMPKVFLNEKEYLKKDNQWLKLYK